MLYIIIRVILILLIIIGGFILIIKSRKRHISTTKDRKFKWAYKLINCSIYIFVTSFLIAVILCPLEDLFLRFNTPEDSYYYSHLPNADIRVWESEHSAFIYDVEYHPSLLHTVTKHNDKWGVTDVHYIKKQFTSLNTKDLSSFYNKSPRLLGALVKRNTESGETCIVVDGAFKVKSSTDVYDSEGRVYKPIYYTPPGKTEEICIGYYTIYEGDIPDTITFYYNNQEYILYGK